MKNLVNVLQLETSLGMGCVSTLSESRLSVVAISDTDGWLSDFGDFHLSKKRRLSSPVDRHATVYGSAGLASKIVAYINWRFLPWT